MLQAAHRQAASNLTWRWLGSASALATVRRSFTTRTAVSAAAKPPSSAGRSGTARHNQASPQRATPPPPAATPTTTTPAQQLAALAVALAQARTAATSSNRRQHRGDKDCVRQMSELHKIARAVQEAHQKAIGSDGTEHDQARIADLSLATPEVIMRGRRAQAPRSSEADTTPASQHEDAHHQEHEEARRRDATASKLQQELPTSEALLSIAADEVLLPIGRVQRVFSTPAFRSYALLCGRLHAWERVLDIYQDVLLLEPLDAAEQSFLRQMPSGDKGLQLDGIIFSLVWRALAAENVRPNPQPQRRTKFKDGSVPNTIPALTAHLVTAATRLQRAHPCPPDLLEFVAYALAFDPARAKEMDAMYEWWMTRPTAKAEADATANHASAQRTYQLLLTATTHLRDYERLMRFTGDYLSFMTSQPPLTAPLILPSTIINSMLYAALWHSPQTIVPLVTFLRNAETSMTPPLPPHYGLDSLSCEMLLKLYTRTTITADLANEVATLVRSILAVLPPSIDLYNTQLQSIVTLSEGLKWAETVELLRHIERQSVEARIAPDLVFFAQLVRLIDLLHRQGAPFSVLTSARLAAPSSLAPTSSFAPLHALLYDTTSIANVAPLPTSWLALADELHQHVLDLFSSGQESTPQLYFNRRTQNAYLPLHQPHIAHECTERYVQSVCYLACRSLKRTREVNSSAPTSELVIETDPARADAPPGTAFQGHLVRPVPLDWETRLELADSRRSTTANDRVSAALAKAFHDLHWTPIVDTQGSAPNSEGAATTVTPALRERAWTFDESSL